MVSGPECPKKSKTYLITLNNLPLLLLEYVFFGMRLEKVVGVWGSR